MFCKTVKDVFLFAIEFGFWIWSKNTCIKMYRKVKLLEGTAAPAALVKQMHTFKLSLKAESYLQ